jgi:chromosome segregation protein
VRRQLRPLERQADAARRHGSLVTELQGIRLHLAGREIATHRARLDANARVRADAATTEAALRSTLATLDTQVIAAEADLTARGGDDLGDALVRFESLRERARGLSALLNERRRSVTRELAASVDQAVIATLEAEQARLTSELADVESEAASLLPKAQELAEAEAALAAERTDFDGDWDGNDVPVPAGGQAAEIRGELAALRAAVQRGAAEVERLEQRLDSLGQKMARLDTEAERLRAEMGEADEAEQPLVASLDEAERSRHACEEALAALEATRRGADADHHSWSARAEALALALDEARARAGAERLADVDGVVGTLLELVEVDEGWEAAFEAAAGEAIAAVVVDGVDAARAAITALRDGGHAGSVLALGGTSVPGSLSLEATVAGEAVRAHVRSRLESGDRLLDTLLATAVCVDGGWQEALDLVLGHPGVVAVTRDGDRFSTLGWRTGAAGAGATGAALDEARRRSAEAEAELSRLDASLLEARQALAAAKAAEAELSRALDANDTRLNGASDGLQRVEGERRDAATEAETLESHLGEVRERVARDGDRVTELETLLPALEAEEVAGVERATAWRAARSRIDQRASAVTALKTDLEVRAAGLDERRTFLSRRLADLDERLRSHAAEAADAGERRVRLESTAVATERLAALVDERLITVESRLADLREQRRRHGESVRASAERLDQLRRERAGAERQLAELREKAQRAELDDTEVRLRLEAAVETLRRDFDCEPESAMAAECPELPPGTTAPHRARELERELRLMGPVNPLALEEFTALQERHTFLEGQLEDVKGSRRELAKVIKAIDNEIVDVFTAAYADVADNFTKLFATLFPGGTGRLRLTSPDDMLETGIEVEARPSGKNVRKLSLLSGGERSLTALAFLFAVFRSRPSPFYLMDEVEAALDDVNLHRFLDLIHEFREEAQLLVVSHQKRTMEAADCLYGVTMQPGGSSRVISERVSAST